MISPDAIDRLIFFSNTTNPALVLASIILAGAVAFYLGWGISELACWVWRGVWIVVSEVWRVLWEKGGHF